MTSQRVERTWLRPGGYERFSGEWVKQQLQKSHKKDILPKNLQIDRSSFASYGTHAMKLLFCVFGEFYARGTQDAEVTKSLGFKTIPNSAPV